jgi:hypothetical protein
MNMSQMNMSLRKLSVVVGSIVLLLLGAGVAGAIPARSLPAIGDVAPGVVQHVAQQTVASGISYQGRLTDAGGSSLDGTYAMRFVVYDDAVAGSALWDSGNLNVAVDRGRFTVQLGVAQADFNGKALWLNIIIEGETLSPRQEILPAPYALSLRPGADIVGDAIGPTDAALASYTPATGTALYADANGGVGLFGNSEQSYGVWGSSNESWGGYFTSEGGYGIRVNTAGTAHFDHGAYITSQGGYGVYAQSAQNQAVRGEAGDVSGLQQPLGAVGVVGIGVNRGTYGSSQSGIGLYGASNSNYGLWAQSAQWRGATGRTSRPDNNYGLYTPDNLFSLNVNLAGAIMLVMRNGGETPLDPGDVVVFSGIDRSVSAVDGPVTLVSRASTANSTAVAGVVSSRFNLDAIDPALEFPDRVGQDSMGEVEVTPAGSAAPGEYVLVVVQGPAQVKVSALGSDAIQPGDLLATSSAAGIAGRASSVTSDGVETVRPGTVFAKALEPVTGAEELIYVFVSLN